MRKPYCHPDLPYYAKGMCRNCYEKDLRKRNPEFTERQKENTEQWVRNHKRWKTDDDRKYQSKPESKDRKSLRNRLRTLKTFGLSIEDEEALIKLQNNKCAICGGERDRKWFDIDHDHETGQVRGLLCSKCNKGIGLLGDCIEGLERALNYLKNPPNNKECI